MTTLLIIVALLGVANFSPIAIGLGLKKRWLCPVDFGLRFFDGRRIFGPSKTWRGMLASILVTAMASFAVGLGFSFGAGLAAFSMLGDLVTSFTKRRLNVAPSGQALILDQVPESLLPLLFAYQLGQIELWHVVVGTMLFVAAEIALSPTLFRWKIRKRPY